MPGALSCCTSTDGLAPPTPPVAVTFEAISRELGPATVRPGVGWSTDVKVTPKSRPVRTASVSSHSPPTTSPPEATSMRCTTDCPSTTTKVLA